MPEVYVLNNPYLDTVIHEGASLYTSNNRKLGSLPMSRDAVRRRSDGESKSIYVMPFHGARVVDSLVDDVKPSEWTDVCKDDKLMRDLLGVWLQCEYSMYIHHTEDYFLEDMASGEKNFCSSLLVNVVLAYSCVSRAPHTPVSPSE